MKKFIKYTCITISGVILFASCKKNNVVVDKTVVAPAFVKFNTIQAADTVGTYYIKSTNDPYKLPIGVTNVSNADRTVQFAYSSTSAALGTQFNAPNSLVIKAGKAVDSLTISGLFAGYQSSARKDTLKISISGGDIPASAYKGNYTLILRKYCDVSLVDFYGDYANAVDNTTYGPYDMGIVPGSAVSTGPTSGTIQVTNLWDYGVPTTITVELDWADPANFKVTIPDQVFVSDDDVWVKNSAAVGTFSSCDQTFTFKYTLYFKSTGAIFYGNQSTVMQR